VAVAPASDLKTEALHACPGREQHLSPDHGGGAELIVSYLAEGLAGAGQRVSVVSTCGPEMEPYPPEQRGGVEIFRFFPPNLYWSFDRNRGPDSRKRCGTCATPGTAGRA